MGAHHPVHGDLTAAESRACAELSAAWFAAHPDETTRELAIELATARLREIRTLRLLGTHQQLQEGSLWG